MRNISFIFLRIIFGVIREPAGAGLAAVDLPEADALPGKESIAMPPAMAMAPETKSLRASRLSKRGCFSMGAMTYSSLVRVIH